MGRKLIATILLISLLLAGCGKEPQVEEEKEAPKTAVQVASRIAGLGGGVSELKAREAKGYLYYFDQLAENEKIAYGELYYGMMRQLPKIYVSHDDIDRAFLLFEYVTHDNPEIFWCDSEVSIYGGEYDEDYVGPPGQEESCLVFEIDYNYSREERAGIAAQLETAIAAVLAGAPVEGSTYEKIQYCFDYVGQNTTFDLSSSDNQNIISVFLNKTSVCAGYSKALQILLERLGIECVYVTGFANNDYHAWNLVKIDGEFKYADLTFQIPTPLAANNSYFLCDYSLLAPTHEFDDLEYLPH
ncbi:transglutaminase/protease-like cytokinesis protein 3 [Lachnospiraceae bacterium PF1-21]|uniref:transglutaminase domain-containing protein n=1 Tax=Ohessyouella blattaphilus TaxID=2949333 RepID=UPI0025684813|nr:hypothetical protein [Lachnospiraceae bacterium OttesenSCG-928-J05]